MIYPAITAAVFFLDSAVKHLADKHLDEGKKYPQPGGLLVIEKYYNRGAALGFLAGRPRLLLGLQASMMLAAGCACGVLARIPGKPLAKTGLALICGGGASNLLDRCARGYVVDYFHLNFGPGRFRRIIYNISDFCIFIGSVLTVLGIED